MALIDVLEDRLTRRYLQDVTAAQLLQALQGTSPTQRNRLVAAVKQRNRRAISEVILEAVDANRRAQAVTDAATMLADGALSEAELETAFGPFD